MTPYRETLSIAGIRMAVESERPFQLSDRCCYFKAACSRPDVIFSLRQGGPFDSRGMTCIRQADRRAFYQRGSEQFHVRYCRETGAVRWFVREDRAKPDVFEVNLLAEDVWQNINPLIFVELSDFMIRHNAMILHSSLISCEGKGIVFTAPSGTGKSTQADLWKKYRGAEILNGDRSILRYTDGYRCYGSPYAGSSGIYVNKDVALTAIVVLRQAKTNRLQRMHPKQAYLSLLSEMSLSPASRAVVEQQSQWVLDLIHAVPVYLLECLPDAGAVDVLYDAWKENCYGR